MSEVRNEAFKVVGAISQTAAALKSTTCMPCDARTNDLLESARVLMNKAVISSLHYAGQIDAEAR